MQRTPLLAAVCLVASCQQTPEPQSASSVPASNPLALTASETAVPQECGARVELLLEQMSVEEKAGQMVQAWQANASPEDVKRHHLGAVFSGGDSAAFATGFDNPGKTDPESWVAMLDQYHAAAEATRLHIPLLYGMDAVHGNSKVTGATIFPHNIGLGCARDAELVQRLGRATALEVAATGVNWVFSPSTIVAADERWGRTFESFAEDPVLTGSLARALGTGLQSSLGTDAQSVVACGKHFAGDGLTQFGSSTAKPTWTTRHGLLDRGDVIMDEADFRKLAVEHYRPLLEAGVLTIMVSFSSWNGVKSHGNHQLLTGILKQELGFRGFVTGDYEGHAGLAAALPDQVVQTVMAGVDMLMEPVKWREVLDVIVEEAGKRIAMERIDDAAGRILRVKCEAGLFERRRDPELLSSIGSQAHRELAREAVRRSLVLLQNEVNDKTKQPALPLTPGSKVYLAGSGASDLTRQCGGWTIDWQGAGEKTQGTTLRQALAEHSQLVEAPEQADVVVVALAEPSYAEWFGDDAELKFPAADVEALRRARSSGKPTVAVMFSGRPMIITEHLALADAWLAAWLPGTEGAGIADVLFGLYSPTGKLSHSWPRSVDQLPLTPSRKPYEPLFPFGYGLEYESAPRLSAQAGEAIEPARAADESSGLEPPARLEDPSHGQHAGQ